MRVRAVRCIWHPEKRMGVELLGIYHCHCIGVTGPCLRPSSAPWPTAASPPPARRWPRELPGPDPSPNQPGPADHPYATALCPPPPSGEGSRQRLRQIAPKWGIHCARVQPQHNLTAQEVAACFSELFWHTTSLSIQHVKKNAPRRWLTEKCGLPSSPKKNQVISP